MSNSPKLGDPARITDWGRMQSARVAHVATPRDEHELQDVVRSAVSQNLKVSVRGIGHSAGGQSFCDGGVMLDMRKMNRVIEVNTARQTVRAQSGANWGDLTKVLEPQRLAITTKQEFESFTLGGSVAANVHGKTVDYGPLIESIDCLRLLKADGNIVTVSRDENADLFPLVIGGYGLFGVVVDVTFRLVPDRIVEKSEVVRMGRDDLIASYMNRIGRQPAPPLCYGFLDAACRLGFYVTYEYVQQPEQFSGQPLQRDEPSPMLFNVLVQLQRWSRFVRDRSFHLMWATSAKPEVTWRSRRLLLWDAAPRAFQDMLLQKYFVPVEHFAEFSRRAGEVFQKFRDDLPLLTNHFRFVPGSDAAVMSFAPRDAICMIPCYLAKKDSARWVQLLELATAQLLDIALELGGSYYLTFDILATRDQFQRAYPRWREYFEQKRTHDPQEMFSSCFYQKYSGDSP